MRRLFAGICFFTLIAALSIPSMLLAQDAAKKVGPPPAPRPVDLQTKDGVKLAGYYFGSNKGKKAIPVLLIHDWKGQKAPYGPLCMALRNAGCAVLTLDYRGHGGSREYVDRFGKTREFDLKTMNKNDVALIVQNDLEAAKLFLKEENNDEKLNMNALVVIGSRDGCVLATGWTQKDWSFATVGSRKRGQDVKALILISPKRQLKGIPIDGMLADPNLAALPIMVVVGAGSSEQSDTDRIYKRIEAVKKKLSGSKEPPGLTLLTVREPLGGADLVTRSPKVIPEIVKFVTAEVEVSEIENPWIERE
jgi:pimeloyl-ACP methyl ester carboxylesterase